jgi:16S rRNA (adenine1518-N6/adenine1519-N6)-dimethyltransferase
MSAGLTPGFAKKSLGQHFLFDRDLLHRIALAGGPVRDRTVLEVGPGPGGLTRALLEEGAGKLIAIEMDDRFAEGLRAWPEAADGRLVVHHGDAMKIDERTLIVNAGGAAPALIVANLPYNVGTPLLVRWLKAGDWLGGMVLMFQKEVAQRICAAPDDDHYGRLAVLAQAACRARIAIVLPPGAFRPPPKVDSAVVVLEPLPASERYADLDAIETVAAAAFNQRRKMLRASLKSLATVRGITAEALLAAASIDPTRRAETLTQTEFRTLATAWRAAGA